jgi:hypothetical protein
MQSVMAALETDSEREWIREWKILLKSNPEPNGNSKSPRDDE